MSHETRLKRAKQYLKQRGISAVAPGSRLVYTDHAGVTKEPPKWLKQENESVVIVMRDHKKGA